MTIEWITGATHSRTRMPNGMYFLQMISLGKFEEISLEGGLGGIRMAVKERLYFTASSAQTSETLTNVGNPILLNGDYPWISFELSLSGGSVIALDTFELQVQMHESGTYVTVHSAWAYLIERMIFCPTALETLAHAASAICLGAYVGQAYRMRFQSAQAGSTASAVTVSIKGLASQDN